MADLPTVAILGAGAMGESLATGLLSAGWSPHHLVLVARRAEQCQQVSARTGIPCSLDLALASVDRDLIVIAVKPGDVASLLPTLNGLVRRGQILVSLAAGVPTSFYEQHLPDVAVVRAMPNTPSRIREGMTVISPGTRVSDVELESAVGVLSALGHTLTLDESVMDAVTAVSGTGPAYVFLLAEALTDAAIREGIPWHAAGRLVEQTLRGAGMLLAASEGTPASLRGEVTSPGGTTAAAMHVLEERGFRAIVEDAVRAAARRSREMGEAAEGGRE